MERSVLFAHLRDMNVETVTVEFSGGNDEGGVDYIGLQHRDGTTTELPCYVQTSRWNVKTGSYDKIPLTIEHQLAEAFNEPVKNHYGSFAGDFHVDGTIVYDVVNETVTLNKSESHEVWTESEEEL